MLEIDPDGERIDNRIGQLTELFKYDRSIRSSRFPASWTQGFGRATKQEKSRSRVLILISGLFNIESRARFVRIFEYVDSVYA